jgi:hypothetical protein
MTKTKELQRLQKIARKLGADLLSTDVAPCTKEQNNQSCVTTEELRPLTKEEKGRGWSRRPFYAYDHRRMCNGCAAYWFASMAALTVDDLVRSDALYGGDK